MKNKKILYLTFAICIIIFLLPNLFYTIKFSSYNFSSTPEHWAQYGDFIGGSLNPILTILNIIALVYLTYTVSELEDKRMAISQEIESNRITEMQLIEGRRATEQINVQKMITLNQMRYEVVTEFSNQMKFDIDTKIHYKQYFVDKLIALENFTGDKRYLFKDLFTQEFESNFILPFKTSIAVLQKYYGQHTNQDEDEEKVVKMFREYSDRKSALVDNLYKFIITELSENN